MSQIMRNRSILILCFTLLSAAYAHAQETRSGYFHKANLSLAKRLNDSGGGISLQYVGGLYITPQVAAGVGVGVFGYRHGPNLYPVSLQAMYFFRDRISSPYVYGDVGYSVHAYQSDVKGGVSTAAGIGWQFKVGGISMGPELGFRTERYKVYGDVTDEYLPISFNQVHLGLTVLF